MVAGGLLTVEQVDQALRAQVMWGGRFGTNLVELEVCDLDALSRSLGLQHGMPSALARHFEKIDKDLQKLLSPDVAEKFSVVPLIKIGADNKVLVATVGPLEAKPIAIIADDMGFAPEQLIVTVAAELRIRYQLERAYNIPRSARFLRARGPAFPQFTTAPDVAETSEVDVIPLSDDVPVAIDEDSSRAHTNPIAAAVARPKTIDDLGLVPEAALVPEAEPGPSEEELKARRTYVRTLSESMPVVEPPPESEETKALGRIALRRIAGPASVITETSARTSLGSTLGEATRAIRRAGDRDRVVELMMMAVERYAASCQAALLLVVRGDVAIGWRGFTRSGRTIAEVAVPLDQSPIARAVIDKKAPMRCHCDKLEAIDMLLFHALGGEDGHLVVVPVVIGEQVMCFVATVGKESTEVLSIATAGGVAFARLMRDASR